MTALWFALATILAVLGLGLLLLVAHRKKSDETGEAIADSLGPSQPLRLFDAGPTPPGYRPGQQTPWEDQP